MMMLSGNGNAAAAIDDSAAGQHAGEIPDATSGLRQRALAAPAATIDQISMHSPVLQHNTSSLLTGDDTLVSGATAASSATTASSATMAVPNFCDDEVHLIRADLISPGGDFVTMSTRSVVVQPVAEGNISDDVESFADNDDEDLGENPPPLE